MKRAITTIATVFALVIGLSASAKPLANPLRSMDSKAIVKTYLETLTTGDLQFNKHLYTNDFNYQNAHNNTEVSKTAYLNFLKSTKGLKYNCETSYEILDQTSVTTVGKATMKFPTFTRVDYITLQYTNDGWKVKEVVTSYL